MRLSWNEIHSRAAAFARKWEGAGMTRWKHPQAIVLIVLLTAAGCSGNKNITDIGPDPCNDGFQRKAFDHHVIGFYPNWKHDVLPVSRIQWDKLTRVIYAFAIPNTDGSLNVSRLTQVEALAGAARAQGVEVFLSVGGGGSGSDNFPAMAANAAARRAFALEIRDYLTAYCFHGVDIDWEHWTKDSNNTPDASEKANLIALLGDLRAELQPHDLEMSIDVYPSNWFGQHFDDEVHSLVDYIHVMAYDFSGPWSSPGPHASYQQAIGSGSDISSTGLSYWTQYREWPRNKTILGLPFYGRDFDRDGGVGVAYRDIVAQYSQAPDADQVANIYYNGVQTITDKTQFVVDNGYPGVMIWEISHDTPEAATSLLHAVDRIANP